MAGLMQIPYHSFSCKNILFIKQNVYAGVRQKDIYLGIAISRATGQESWERTKIIISVIILLRILAPFFSAAMVLLKPLVIFLGVMVTAGFTIRNNAVRDGSTSLVVALGLAFLTAVAVAATSLLKILIDAMDDGMDTVGQMIWQILLLAIYNPLQVLGLLVVIMFGITFLLELVRLFYSRHTSPTLLCDYETEDGVFQWKDVLGNLHHDSTVVLESVVSSTTEAATLRYETPGVSDRYANTGTLGSGRVYVTLYEGDLTALQRYAFQLFMRLLGTHKVTHQRSHELDIFTSDTHNLVSFQGCLQRRLSSNDHNSSTHPDGSQSSPQSRVLLSRRVNQREDIPSHWVDPTDVYSEHKVSRASNEWSTATGYFTKTKEKNRSYEILEVIRIQNPHSYRLYSCLRDEVARKLGKPVSQVEKQLFHGTKSENIAKITKKKFDRGLSGAVGANLLGAGCYFSSTSAYSAREMFSPATRSGEKYMIVARVITGEYCKGASSMKCAPYKDHAAQEQYDSVVDNVNSPSIYAVFHDAAAHSDYVIKFRSRPVFSPTKCLVM